MTFSELRTQVRSEKILLAAAACWALEAYMNAAYGLKIGGPGLAAGLLMLAFFAAWLPVKLQQIHGEDGLAWCKRAFLAVPLLFCVVTSQVAGWATMGAMLADGRAARDDQATGRSVVKDSLQGKRDELTKLGVQRAPSQVTADVDGELAKLLKSGKTIGAATQLCADPGPAPVTCKRVADLKRELEASKRRVDLEGEISGVAGRLDKTVKVAEGTHDLDVLHRMTGADKKDIAFWLSPVLVAIIGFFANFGVALTKVQGGAPPAPPPSAVASFWDSLPPAMRPAGPGLPHPDWANGQRPPTPTFHGLVGGAPAAHPSHGSHPSHGPQHMAGSPISIVFGGGPPGSPGQGVAYPVSSPAAGHEQAALPAPVLVRAPSPVASERHDLDALPADAPPVDRLRLTRLLGDDAQSALDVALSFRAACVVDAPGAMVGVEDLYRRYRAWVGERAVQPAAFDTLMDAIGVRLVQIGAALHASDVSLKAAPALQSVA